MLLGFLTGLYQYPLARTIFYFAREIGIFGIVIIATAIFYSNYHFRKQFNFKDSLQAGFFITIIIAMIGALFLYVYIGYIHPAFRSFILKCQQFAHNAADIAFIKETNARKFMPVPLMASGFLQLMFQGIVLSLVISILSRLMYPDKSSHKTKVIA